MKMIESCLNRVNFSAMMGMKTPMALVTKITKSSPMRKGTL